MFATSSGSRTSGEVCTTTSSSDVARPLMWAPRATTAAAALPPRKAQDAPASPWSGTTTSAGIRIAADRASVMATGAAWQIGRASGRERVGPYEEIAVGGVL